MTTRVTISLCRAPDWRARAPAPELSRLTCVFEFLLFAAVLLSVNVTGEYIGETRCFLSAQDISLQSVGGPCGPLNGYGGDSPAAADCRPPEKSLVQLRDAYRTR